LSVLSPEAPKPDDTVVQRELYNDLDNLKSKNEALRQDIASQARTIASNQEEKNRLQSQIEKDRADREELAQLKKEAKEAAADVHREGRSIEFEKVRWQQQLSDARAELAEAKATILKQGDKIQELERGYSFKPNPVESALRLEIGELRSQLAELQQNPAPAIDLSSRAGEIVNFFRTLLPKDTKLPKNTMSKLREILEATED
jgi:chromosome segregation ATPase